jgi:predicted dehydrogenase
VEVVAGCDVDETATAKFREKFPQARIYRDYRELLEKERDLQSVNVSTPDHMHAPMGLACLERGVHVYGQKPLAHDLGEVRRLTQTAAARGLQTQMGIQIHSGREYRTAVRWIQEGAIGKVREVHTWSDKKWGDLGSMPPGGDVIPDGFDWNLWLGVCAERPFIGGRWYHPGQWRKRLDFGTGTFGDMGCHIFDPVFKALALSAPLTVTSTGAAPSEHSWATDACVRYVFPKTPFTEGESLAVTWYDGTQMPSEEVLAHAKTGMAENGSANVVPKQGSIFLGTDGVLVLPHIGMPRICSGSQKDKPRQSEDGSNHWHLFIDAVMGGAPCSAGFGYAGPLTEAVLLGSVATRFPGKELSWDSVSQTFGGVPEANRYVRREYRKF